MTAQRHWNLSFLASWIDFFITASFPARYTLNSLQTASVPRLHRTSRKRKKFPELLHYHCGEGFIPIQEYGMEILVLMASTLSLLCMASATLGTSHHIMANPGFPEHRDPWKLTISCLGTWAGQQEHWRLDRGSAFNPAVTISFATSEESQQKLKTCGQVGYLER